MIAKSVKSFSGKYSFLSNFYPSSLTFDNVIYRTAEHAYQASKATNSRDRLRIQLKQTPGEAKYLGNNIQLRDDWESVKYDIMYDIVNSKFRQDNRLKSALLRTDKRKIVEGNSWHDNVWGDCFCSRCKDIEGQNHLGKILMRIRKELHDEMDKSTIKKA